MYFDGRRAVILGFLRYRGGARMAINFENRAVAYLDILGFKDFIEQAERPETEQQRQLVDLEETIRTEIKGEGYHPLLKPTCTFISDSIICSARVGDDDCGGLVGVTMKTIQIAHRLLRMGFLLRGGITIGTVSHDSHNIYGTGYMDALRTEQEAHNPKVLLADSAASLLERAPDCGVLSVFLREGDKWVVNTLEDHHETYTGVSGPAAHTALFTDYRQTIVRNLEQHPLGSDIRGKWEWMAGFFNYWARHGNTSGVETISLPMPPLDLRAGMPLSADTEWMDELASPSYRVVIKKPT